MVRLLWAAAIGWAGLVRAAPDPRPPSSLPTLVWDAPAGCPTGAVVLDNVQRILADAARAGAPVAATAHVSVASSKTWQADLLLQLAGTQTERRFQAESCDAVAAAAALIIAVAAEGEPASPPPPPAPASPPAPRTPAETAEKDATEPAPIAGPGSRFFVGASGLGDWRTMPLPAAGGVELFGGWKRSLGRHGSLRLLGTAGYFPTRHLPFSSADVFGDWWMAQVSARGCASLTALLFEIGACAGGEVDVLHGESLLPPSETNGDTLPPTTDWWLSGVLGGTASVAFTPAAALVSRFDLVVPTDRPIYGTRGGTDHIPSLYKVPAAAFRLAVGLEWAFE